MEKEKGQDLIKVILGYFSYMLFIALPLLIAVVASYFIAKTEMPSYLKYILSMFTAGLLLYGFARIVFKNED